MLTDRQAEVLAYIVRFKGVRGFPPTHAEIARHFGWKSLNAASDHLKAMERKGVLTLTPKTARGILVRW